MRKIEMLKVGTSAVAFCGMIALMATMSSTNVMAAETSGTGGAKAKIIAPLEVQSDTGSTSTDIMNFGTVLKGATSVVLTNAGARTVTPDTSAVADGNTPQAGTVRIVSSSKETIPVTVAFGNASLTGSKGGTLTVSGINSDKGNSFTLDSSGTTTLKVGGTLSDTTNANAGDYSGTYDITVTY